MIRHVLPLLCLAALGLAQPACTDPVPDIDRTQGNLIRKADMEGEWYMLETIAGVPPTSWFTFIGETSKMERVRFVIQESLLVAYRSYPLVPGADSPSGGLGFDGTDNPVAAWPIVAHVDIIRDYNASTGEQSNVIVEDSSDRLWHERDYIRVDWTQNKIANFDFIAPTTDETSLGYFVTEEQGGEDAFYREEKDGALSYFDVLGKLFVQPDEWGCYYAMYGWSPEDCTSAEITVRSSFSRVPPTTYEPFQYDDRLMSRYGYFRTERYTYDEQRGVVESNRRFLIQRHDIWQSSQDTSGKPIPIPDRTVRTVPYYLSQNFPQDELLIDAARNAIAQWNVAAQKGVKAAQGKDSVPDVFVLCTNPVAAGEHEACGAEGFSPRIGDLRYSTLHWVDPETLEGLLGYGPSAADPITGEIISGKAYVYGAAVNTYASYATDIIRYFNEDIDFDTLVHGGQFTDEVVARLEGKPSVVRPDARLGQMNLDRPLQRPGRAARPDPHQRQNIRAYDPAAIEARLQKAREAGLTGRLVTPEVQRALAHRTGTPLDDRPEARAELDPTQLLNPEAHKRRQRLRAAARARGVDFQDLVAPDLQGIVRRYLGRTDYDQMWRELRAEVFASTAEHEVGHTLGLRHNFQGSYDSLNYFDTYWDLRSETLKRSETVADLYDQVELTDGQHAGFMRQFQYSSIMDYGYSWQNDIMGLGKYDVAALIFGYTAGSYRATGARCTTYESVADGSGCFAKQPGLVEVFKKHKDALGEAGDLLTREERGFTYDDPGLPSVNLLERFDYSTVATAFPSLDDLADTGRELMPYADFLDAKAAGGDRPVRVPHMFCSDEWEGGLISCRVFDQGANPFELTLSRIHDYRAFYPFVNYKRDRVGFFEDDPLYTYLDRVFLPLSDYFQSWYFAPYGFDDAFDRSYDLAINSGLSLLGEALSTPPYGAFCAAPDGNYVWLSDEPTAQGETYATNCVNESETFEIQRGVGRRPFSSYDAQEGYYFSDKPQESGHYWTTLAALWALFDPDAYVVGSEGDAGFYAISFYDWFPEEINRLMANLMTENYAAFAPRARLSTDRERTLEVNYVPAAPLYDYDAQHYYNAETGAPIEDIAGNPVEIEPTFGLQTDIPFWGFLLSTASYSTRFVDGLNVFRPGNDAQITVDPRVAEQVDFTDPASGIRYAAVQPRCDGASGGATGVCGICEANEECVGFTGFTGGVFCQPINDNDDMFRCLIDCTDGPESCRDGETCDPNGNCVPDGGGVCRGQGACAPDAPYGTCPNGQTCFEGACVERVQLSDHCDLIQPEDTGAVQLVRHGQDLATAYNQSLRAWYEHDAEADPREDDRLATAYFRNKYRLQLFVDLLETTIATYKIFGRIY